MDKMPPGQTDNTETAQALNSQAFSEESADISLFFLWSVLLRRRALVFSILLFALCAGIYLALQPSKFTAAGSLQVRSGSSEKYKLQASELAGGGDSDDRIETEVNILQSKSLYTKVAVELRLAQNPLFMPKGHTTMRPVEDPYVGADVVQILRKMIKVQRTPKTQIITIECTSTSPLLASQIANTLVNEYVERIYTTRFASTQRAAKYLAQQLGDLKNQVLDNQQKLVDLQGKLGGIGLDDTHNLVTSQLEVLAGANQQASIARITAEARYRILQDERPDLVDGGPALLSANASTGSSLLQTLRATHAQVAKQYANDTEQFGPNFPETKRLQAELAESTAQIVTEENRVLEQSKIAFEAAARNQSMTSLALETAKNRALASRNDMVAYQILLHDYQSSRTLYEGLMQRLREAGVVSGLESSDIEVIDLATLPTKPTGHGRLTMIAISLGLGSVLAAVVAFIVQSADTTVHSVDALERFIKLPVLAVLPNFQLGRKQPEMYDPASPSGTQSISTMQVVQFPKSYFAEGIRLLRSNLLLARASQRPRSMVFTSSMPGEGKSTVCGNEACMLAQDGARVLLIDADLRRPTQHHAFQLTNVLGLTNVLTNDASFRQCVQEYAPVPTLHLLTSGPLPPSPGQLLGSTAMQQLMEQLYLQYDYILLDAPPLAAITDAILLAASSDIVVLVVRSGIANKKTLLRVRNTLIRLEANISGFVFNAVDRNSLEYYEFKQYGYKEYGETVDYAKS